MSDLFMSEQELVVRKWIYRALGTCALLIVLYTIYLLSVLT